MNLLQLAIARKSRAFHANGVHDHILGEQNLERVGIAGAAADLASIADDENNLPARAIAFREIARRQQDSIVDDVGFFWRRNYGLHLRIHRTPVDDRTLWSQRPTRDRRPIVAASVSLYLVQDRCQLLAH